MHLITTEVQRPNESIIRQLDTTNLGGSPTTPAHDCKLIASSSSTDASDKLSGTASVDGNNVVSGALSSLVDGSTYHQIIRFTIDGNILEYYWKIICDDERPDDAA